MRFYIVSGILLIIPIVDLALAAPVLVKEKRQTRANIADIPEYPVTVLEKRVGDEIEEVGVKYIENYFAKPEESLATNPSSSSPSSGLEHGWVDVKHPQPSVPASSTSDADHEPLVAHPPPPPPVSSWPTVPDHELTEVDGPLSSAVNPIWYFTPHGYMGPHASQPKLGPSDQVLSVEEPPSRTGSLTVTDADYGYQEVHPPSAAPSGSDFEKVDHDVPASSAVWLTKPDDHQSMGEDSRLENLQAVGDTLKGNAKESRGISGIARDVLNAAKRESQRVRSLVPGE